MATVCKVIEIARQELGQTENPPNSNRTKYGEWFGLNGQPWCAIFVTWVFAQAGLDLRAMLGKGIEYTPTFASLGKRAGWQRNEIKAGDILLFKFGLLRISHVGIAVEDARGSTVVTIEGNTSLDVRGSQTNGGIVAQRVRPVSKVACILRPPYETCTAPAPPINPAQGLADLARAIQAAKRVTLSIGAHGEPVKVLQLALKVQVPNLESDGAFGARTLIAVRDFQRTHGLVVDGVVGPATWASLYPG